MIRVSATLLDAFRLLQGAEFMTPEEFDARVRRDPLEPSFDMRLGTAFHAIPEGAAELRGDPQSPEGGAYAFDGFLFDARSADHALRLLKGGVPEVKRTEVIQSRHGPITLVGKADYLRGVIADEIKTKHKKDFDVENYADAWQWRVYCRVFSVWRVVYHLVRLDEIDGLYFAKSDTLSLHPYPGLAAEVEGAARDLVDYCASRGLLEYLNQSSELAA